MAIDFTVSSDAGAVSFWVSSDFSSGDVQLSAEEKEAVSLVLSAAGSFSGSLHCERRSDAYLSIVGPEYGDDFCRLKVSSRTCWISLDLGGCDVSDDPRLSGVKNKRVRHWKIPLSSVSDISSLSDLVQLALGSTSLKP